MNDAWEANADGVCQPKAEFFALHCNADGMMVEMSPEVVPNALEVSIGSCSGAANAETGKWEVNSALDGCSTSLSTGEGHGHSILLKVTLRVRNSPIPFFKSKLLIDQQ